MTDRAETAVDYSVPPIVLVAPAMAIGSGYYRPLLEELRHRGWEATALTRRGFEPGLPRASRTEDWSYADEIDDVAQAVAAARAERPDRPVLLLGHSLGGQLVAGHESGHPPADGIVTVGAAIPRFRHFAHGGLPLAFMASVIVPVTTTLFGHLPKPAFGGPGARTLTREWARMVLTGQPPFPSDQGIPTDALIVSLADDHLAPRAAVDDLADRLFAPSAVTRWHYEHEEVPAGGSNDHITWVRSPAPVVDHLVRWWSTVHGELPTSHRQHAPA